MLDFSALQVTNSRIHQQVIHKVLWTAWGLSESVWFVSPAGAKGGSARLDSIGRATECRLAPFGKQAPTS
jgi:hypothetical protein